MLGLSSSCDATVRLTRKASIPEKLGDVKEFVSFREICLRSEIVFDSDIAFAVILRCSDICPFGKLRIYLNFGFKPKYNFDEVKISLWQKPKYHLRSKYNRPPVAAESLLKWGPRGILCTRGEKAHTSKRVSIIACNNVISKVQLSGTPRDTVYPWGKGANKHKSEHCRPDNAISTAQFAPGTLYEFW